VPGGPEALEFVRILQEFDDLLQVLFRLIDARDILEGHAAMALREELGFGLAEAHGFAAARLHLADEEYPHTDQEQRRQPVEQRIGEEAVILRRLGVEADVPVPEQLDQFVVAGRIGGEGFPARELAVQIARA
jgi:hypothetical protein